MPPFTPKQGQYLAYIALYTKLHRQPPAERDLQHYFGVTPPSVHRMVNELLKKKLITKLPRTPRSIRLTIPEHQLPQLEASPIDQNF